MFFNTQSTWEFLNNTHPMIATFYAIPKVHKNIVKPPGRPFISRINNLTNNGSILVDKFLKPFVVKLPSFLKDNAFFKYRNVILVSIDVDNLYSNIPHLRDIKVINFFWSWMV